MLSIAYAYSESEGGKCGINAISYLNIKTDKIKRSNIFLLEKLELHIAVWVKVPQFQ